MSNYLTRGQFRVAKARLTRAVNSGDAQKVIDCVDRQFAEWDAGDYAYPDAWQRWERARGDAELEARR